MVANNRKRGHAKLYGLEIISRTQRVDKKLNLGPMILWDTSLTAFIAMSFTAISHSITA